MKKFLALIVACVMTVSLSACGGGGGTQVGPTTYMPGDESGNPYEDMKMGLSIPEKNTYYSLVVSAAEDFCDANDMHLTVTEEDYDIEAQKKSIDSFIDDKMNIIVLVPFDEAGIEESVQKAASEAIFVMTLGGSVEGAHGVCSAGEAEIGYAVGKLCADWIKGNSAVSSQDEIEIGVLDYEAGVESERAEGIKKALNEFVPNAVLITDCYAADESDGKAAGKKLLEEHPDISAVCGVNDAGVLGVYFDWEEREHLGGNVGLFGAGGMDEAIALVIGDTSYRGIVVSDVEESLQKAFQVCADGAFGQNVDGVVESGLITVTAANVPPVFRKR